MCTVTYIPQHGHRFILTSNRDEAPHRSPQNITRTNLHGLQLLFPKDAGAGGTWIAAADDGRVVCLLNGAFEKHKHQPPYRRSRGIMVLDYFKYDSPETFCEQYDFTGMEPFTFIMAGQNAVHELRWDEEQAHTKKLDPNGYYIWSSATLYTPEIRQKREGWFADWLTERGDFSLKAINEFHKNGGKEDDWNGFIMNRMEVVRTVSITNVVQSEGNMEMIYQDLLREQTTRKKIPLKTTFAKT